MTDRDPPKNYFHTLSGIRGLAALFVLAYHIGYYIAPLHVPFGFAAVDLFFLLSGTVIEASYGRRLRADMSFRRFLRIRLVRLYPLYMLGTVIMLVAIAAAPHHIVFVDPNARVGFSHVANLFAASIILLPLFHAPILYPLNPPAWSLFWELAVNGVYAVLVPFLTRGRLLVIVAGSGIALVFVTGSGALDTSCAGAARAAFSFFLGVFIYRHLNVKRLPARFSAAFSALSVVATCIVLALPTAAGAIYLASVFVLFPAIVWLALQAQPAPWLRPIWDFLGDISYPLYASHLPLAALLLAFTGAAGGRPWSGLGLAMVLLLAAWAMDRLYDRPVRRGLSALIDAGGLSNPVAFLRNQP